MLLLDSQAVLWVLDDSERLGAQARRSIETSSEVHVSAATVWELTIKSMLGKLRQTGNLTERLESEGFVLLDVTSAHADGLREFPELVRHDPFDRLILAQARIERMRLLTADRVLLGLGHSFVVDAQR